MFLEIWEERPHKSFVSGKNLDVYRRGTFFVNLFAHVLGKGAFPRYKLNKENIVLLTPQEHHLLDAGTKDQRERYAEQNNCSWEKLYELKEKLKQQYYNEKN
jgi:hypothetical protein